MNMQVGKWLVEALEDDDGHLTMTLSHSDDTAVVCCDVDIAANDTEWSDRFTTKGIEATYAQEINSPNSRLDR